MKGVAILMMIFLHLFNQGSNVELCHNFIQINGLPLVEILSRASNPVAFFLILGGYGMYKVYEKGDRHRWSRVGRLYINYWITLAIFLLIGWCLNSSRYPGSWQTVISNFSGFHTTYNGEMWFLLPYVILSLLSPWIFRLYRHFNPWGIIASTLFIHLCTSFCISRYGSFFLFHNYWVYNPLLVFHLLFNFSLGAMAARSHFFERLANHSKSFRTDIPATCGIIVLVFISCVFKYNFFYAFGIITCLLFVPMPGMLKTVLAKLGDMSMNMWMIHSWFCYYLFHDFIYSFSYPVLIFLVTTLISYFSARMVAMLSKPVENIFMSRKELNTKPIL